MNVFTDNLKKIFQYFGSKIFAKKIPVENKDAYNASQKTDRFRKGNFSIVSNRVDDVGVLKRRGAENVKSGEVAKAKIISHPIKKRRASIVENENKIRETNILSNNLQNEYEDRSVLAEVVNSGVNIVMKDNKKGIFFFGSGVILNENGFIITNDHVVQDSEGNVAIQLLDYDGNALEVDGKVFYRDKKSDVAIIKINPEEVGIKLKPISLEIQEPDVGDKVMTIGNAKGFGIAEKNYYGVLPEALIEKKGDGRYLSFSTGKEILMKNILKKENGGKYKDSNGQVFVRENNNFYSEKDGKQIEDRGSIMIEDKNGKMIDINHKRIFYEKLNGKLFVDGNEVRDILSISKWRDKPWLNDLYIDVSIDDAFLHIEKKDLKRIKFGFHEKDTGKLDENGKKIVEKILHNDGLIERDGKKYVIGNYKFHSMSGSIGKVKNRDANINGNIFLESELMAYPGGSGGMVINSEGKLLGIHTRGTYGMEKDEVHTKHDPVITSYSVPTKEIINVINRAQKYKNVRISYTVDSGSFGNRSEMNFLDSDLIGKFSNMKSIDQEQNNKDNSKVVDLKNRKSYVDTVRF